MSACVQPGAAERLIGARTGSAPGPTVVLLAAVHGNEPAGIDACRRVLSALESVNDVRGRVAALIGNMCAVHRAEGPRRYCAEDLNRLFTPTLVEEARATPADERRPEQRELVELLTALEGEFATAEGPVYVLDLHTFSSPSPPFAGIEDSLPARRFACRFPLPILLGFEEHLRGLLIDYIGQTYGHVAMVVEAGVHDDPASVDRHEAVVRTALAVAGVVPPGSLDEQRHWHRLAGATGRRVGRFYDIHHRQPVNDPSFTMAAGFDATTRVRRGRSVVAHEDGRPIVAPLTGVLFLPNRQTERRAGDDGCFVVRRVRRVWLGASAWLRTRRWVHALLPRVLPGVRRDPGDPARLFVAPEIAVVFKREVFHLLGYRVWGHGAEVHLSAAKRAVLAVAQIGRAVAKMMGGLFHGGEPAALPTLRPEDWIVARRRLDLEPLKELRT